MADTNEYIAKRGQSLFDIVIENQGDITAVFDFVDLNGFDGITDMLYENDVLKTPLTVAAPRVVIRNAPVMPIATLEVDLNAELGIGEMEIGNTFIIR